MERIIQSEVTTVIDVDYGTERFGTPYPNSNILGSASSAIRTSGLDVSGTVAAFKRLTTDPQLTALYNAIPVPTPSTLRADGSPNTPVTLTSLLAGTIPLQVYGLLPARLTANTTQAVPNIGFNSAFRFDFDPRDGIERTKTDFEGVATHEIGHTLGFVSSIGFSTASSPVFFPWDLFRVRPDAVQANESLGDGVGWEVAERVVTPGPFETEVTATIEGIPFFTAVQVFFDGRQLLETSTATGAGAGGDGNQASHWRDDRRRSPELGDLRKIGIMDPNSGRGELGVISDFNIRLLEVIGYSVNYDPPTAEARYAVNGQAVDTESQILISRSVPLADVAAGQPGTATVTVSNLDPAVGLDYEVEFILNRVVTSGAPPAVSVTLANETGTVAPGGATNVTLTYSASGTALVYGSLLLRSNDESQYVVNLPIAFAAGGASFPTLQADPIARQALVDTQQPTTIEVQNPSALAGLSYLRILEPALSLGAPAVTPPPPAARRSQGRQAVDVSARPGAEAGVQARVASQMRASTALPGASFPFGITELADGRLLISDVDLSAGATVLTPRLFFVSNDLATVTTVASPITDQYITALAYDEGTGNIWMSNFNGFQLVEAQVAGETVTLTGTVIELGFAATSISFSAELDALVVTANQSDQVHFIDRTGTPLPGYPISVAPIPTATGRSSVINQSFREGVLEISGLPNELLQYDQFGRDFPDSERIVFTVGGAELMGANRFLGYVRSRVNYNDRAFYLLDRAGDTSSFFVVDVDPPDFPARVGTVLDATEREAVNGVAPAGGMLSLDFSIDTRGQATGQIDESLAYLTSNPTQPIVIIPVTVSIQPVANEGQPGDAFTVVGAVPNPVRGAGGAVRLQLAQAATVTVTLYNVLGQRVAILAQESPLGIGTHDLALGAGDLAAGTYLVHVQAGEQVSTKTLTVVR